jgi:DNA-directed RNA polymerase subunit M/transcription elongation factor TFIIS
MYGRPDQVGRKIKCPDCGAQNEVKPPPAPKRKNTPAALEGDQYELYDADVRPTALKAAQPNYIAVKCRQCDTMMYATEKQVGQTIDCPDCGRKAKVPAPAVPKPVKSVLAAEAQTPKLDPAFAPFELPPAVPAETLQRIEAELDATPYGQALVESRRTGKPLTVDRRGRPILPRWPLLTGVLPFMISRGVPVRWLGLSLGLGFSVATLLSGLALAMSGGMGALAGMCIFVVGCVATMFCSSLTASSLLAIIGESSDGNKEIQSWPSVFDSFGDLLLFAVAGMVSAFPGWLVGHFAVAQIEYKVLAIATGMLLVFPVILLSQLDIGSMWAVVSPKVLRSMARFPFSWLMFYIESALITAGCLAAAYSGSLWVLVPVAVAGLILYARLLGRLGWRLAEAI